MKVQVITSNIIDTATFNEGISLVKSEIGTLFPIEISIVNTNTVFTTQPFTTSIMNGYEVVPEEILGLTDGTPDIVFLIFSNENLNPKPLNPVCTFEKKVNAVPCQMASEWYQTNSQTFCEFMFHEWCHTYSFKTGKIDITHLLTDGTLQSQNPILYKKFAILQPKDWYLYLLNALINVPSESNLPPDDPSHLFNTQTGTLNSHYIGLQAPTNVVTPESAPLSISDIITSICIKNGVEPELGIAVAMCESGLNPKATLFNPSSNSTDRGLFQWNSKYHVEIPDIDAFDPTKATEWFCKYIKENTDNLHGFWSASQACWSTKLSSAIKSKYGIS